MILPQVHLRKPCYDFSFLSVMRFAKLRKTCSAKRVFTVRSDRVRSRMSSTPLFTDQSPKSSTCDATEWGNQRLKQVARKKRRCCVLSLARRHSCKPCVKVSATSGVWTVDQGSVGHTDTARNQNCTLPPPIALFKCVGWNYIENTNSEYGLHVT